MVVHDNVCPVDRRREKTFNYFNIMYQKRLKATGDEGDDEETAADGKGGGGGSRKKGLVNNDER